MGRAARRFTQAEKAAARAQQKALWEKSLSAVHLRQLQRRGQSRRHTTVAHITHLPPLPYRVYDWAKCRDRAAIVKQPAYLKALQDDYDTTHIAHWLDEPPSPFEVPDEYRATSNGPVYRAETQQLVYAVHARLMLSLQMRETARRQLEERLGRVDATNAWRNQVQHLLFRWSGSINGVDNYDAKTQSRERAMWTVHMHWLAVEIDRLYHLKFLTSH
uniref:Uncharacterized protein n=1 Tax=Mycena chlorophos TaxID=658473 RepID=A0ABQ0KUU5_MYCCL|nr:predicted protein [Mycena chlorophos]